MNVLHCTIMHNNITLCQIFHIIIFSLFQLLVWQRCEKRPSWCLLVIPLNKMLYLSSTSTVVCQIILVLVKDWNNVLRWWVWYCICHTLVYIRSVCYELAVSWSNDSCQYCSDSQIMCVHDQRWGTGEIITAYSFFAGINLYHRNLLHCTLAGLINPVLGCRINMKRGDMFICAYSADSFRTGLVENFHG